MPNVFLRAALLVAWMVAMLASYAKQQPIAPSGGQRTSSVGKPGGVDSHISGGLIAPLPEAALIRLTLTP